MFDLCSNLLTLAGEGEERMMKLVSLWVALFATFLLVLTIMFHIGGICETTTMPFLQRAIGLFLLAIYMELRRGK